MPVVKSLKTTGGRPAREAGADWQEAAGAADPGAWCRCGDEERKDTSGRPASVTALY